MRWFIHLQRSILGPRQAALTPQHSSLKSMWPSRFSSKARNTPDKTALGTGGLKSGPIDSKSNCPDLAVPLRIQKTFSRSSISCVIVINE